MSGPRKQRACRCCSDLFTPTDIDQVLCRPDCASDAAADLVAAIDRKLAVRREQAALLVVADGCPHSIGTGDVCDNCRRLIGPAVRR